MKKRALLTILGALLLAGQLSVRAASPPTEWPSLNADAAQTNSNAGEKTFTAQNVLKLKVKWTTPIAESSYPIVANGRVYVPINVHPKVHIQALDPDTGKKVLGIPKDAVGGMVAVAGAVFLAGHVLQAVDANTGEKVVQINASPGTPGGTFINPVADQKLLLAGYATASKSVPTSLYAVDRGSNQISWKVPSVDAAAAIGVGRILTQTLKGTSFYNEATGKVIAEAPNYRSPWFAGDTLLYTVTTVGTGNATLYAYNSSARLVWKRVVARRITVSTWPHAFTTGMLFTETLTPQSSIQALDPVTGEVQWTQRLDHIQRMVYAGGLLFVVTYALGNPVRLVILAADSGRAVGAIVLSNGYYYFNTPNGLMVANGRVFVRLVGPNGMQLMALGL